MRETAPAWDAALRAGVESVVCDLKAEPGFAQSLCERADVVLESFRPGVAERLGIGPDDVPERVVYCSITGFGLGGRHEQRAGHDLNYLGWAGVLEDTAPGLPPVQAADLAAGALGAVVRDPGRAPRARADRPRRPSRRLDDARLARPRRAPARRRAGPEDAHGRARLLPHLRDRGRAPPDRGRARAEVLRAAVRGSRPARARRPGSTARIRTAWPRSSPPSSPGGRSRSGSSSSTARTCASGRSGRAPRPPPSSGRRRCRRLRSSARTPTPGAASSGSEASSLATTPEPERRREGEQRVDAVRLVRAEAVAVEEDRADPERPRALDVVLVRVPDHRGLLRRDVERLQGCDEDRRVRLDPPVQPRADHRVDLERMVRDELGEVALAVRHEADPQAVTPELVERRQRVLVEREVLVPLPLANHLGRALARAVRVAAHAAHDLLRERDPDLVVVHELALALEDGDRPRPRGGVQLGIERPAHAARRAGGTPPGRAPARAGRA